MSSNFDIFVEVAQWVGFYGDDFIIFKPKGVFEFWIMSFENWIQIQFSLYNENWILDLGWGKSTNLFNCANDASHTIVMTQL